MTLAEFKSSFGLSAINLFKSKSSNRLVGSFMHNAKEHRIISTEQFNSNSPVYVYPTEIVDEESGEASTIYVLSNKTATPAVTL